MLSFITLVITAEQLVFKKIFCSPTKSDEITLICASQDFSCYISLLVTDLCLPWICLRWLDGKHCSLGLVLASTQLARSIGRVSAHLFANNCTGGQHAGWSKNHIQNEKGLEVSNRYKQNYGESGFAGSALVALLINSAFLSILKPNSRRCYLQVVDLKEEKHKVLILFLPFIPFPSYSTVEKLEGEEVSIVLFVFA